MRDEMTIGRIQLDLLEELVPDAISDPVWMTVSDLAALRADYSRRSVYEALSRLASKGCLSKSTSRTAGPAVAYRVTQKGIDAYHRAIFDKRRVPGAAPEPGRTRRDWRMGDPRAVWDRDTRFVVYDRLSGEYWLGENSTGHMFFHDAKPSIGPNHPWPQNWLWFPFPNSPKGRTLWVS